MGTGYVLCICNLSLLHRCGKGTVYSKRNQMENVKVKTLEKPLLLEKRS